MSSTETTTCETYFAPAGRDGTKTVEYLHQLTGRTGLLELVMETCPMPFMLLNEKRQIITANAVLCNLVRMPLHEVLGIRPGEILKCEYSSEGPDGCGTGPHCRYCGAVGTLLKSIQNDCSASGYCRVRLQNGNALNLRISASPVIIEGLAFTTAFVEDVSDYVRKQEFERTFFHDLANVAGGIFGLSKVLVSQIDLHAEHADEIRVIESSAQQMLDEIKSHQYLIQAESGDLSPCYSSVDISDFLRKLGRLYGGHEVGQGRTVFFGEVCRTTVTTDEQLLARVLGNMVKNALEATPAGGRVLITCRDVGDRVVFAVHNDTVMPDEVRLQVFQRSFSTKGSGRGVGTHSMKLLGERYLKGRVSFTSEAETGTTFEFVLPKGPDIM